MGYHRDEEYDSDMVESEEGFSDDGFSDVSDDNGSSWKVPSPPPSFCWTACAVGK